jgi:hypothetical protein
MSTKARGLLSVEREVMLRTTSTFLVYAAIATGDLTVRQLEGSNARRVWHEDAERWYREKWLPARTRSATGKTRKAVPHAD